MPVPVRAPAPRGGSRGLAERGPPAAPRGRRQRRVSGRAGRFWGAPGALTPSFRLCLAGEPPSHQGAAPAYGSRRTADGTPARRGMLGAIRPLLVASRQPDRRCTPREEGGPGGDCRWPPASGCLAAGSTPCPERVQARAPSGSTARTLALRWHGWAGAQVRGRRSSSPLSRESCRLCRNPSRHVLNGQDRAPAARPGRGRVCGTNAAGAPALASLHPGAGDRAPASPRRHDSILLHHGQLKRLTSFITKNVAEVFFFFLPKILLIVDVPPCRHWILKMIFLLPQFELGSCSPSRSCAEQRPGATIGLQAAQCYGFLQFCMSNQLQQKKAELRAYFQGSRDISVM